MEAPGTFSCTPILGCPPWDTTYNQTNPFTWTFLGVARANIEATHGRATFGGGGTDAKVIVGPLSGSEATIASVHFLATATAPSASNAALYGDGAGVTVNAPSGSVFIAQAGASVLAKWDTAGGFFRSWGQDATHAGMWSMPWVSDPNNKHALYFGSSATVPAATNYSFLGDQTSVWFNAPAAGGNINFYTANTTQLATFNTTLATFTVPIASGTTPAAAGQLRVPNNVNALQGRRSDNAADIAIASLDNNNRVDIGGSTTGSNSASAVLLWHVGGYVLTWGNVGNGILSFDSANGFIQGGNGFTVDVTGGPVNAGTAQVSARLGLGGAGGGARQPMVEAAEPTLGRRVLGLVHFANLAAANFPAGTGDGVVAIANAATAPTAAATGAGLLFVSGGALKYMGTAGTLTTLAAA